MCRFFILLNTLLHHDGADHKAVGFVEPNCPLILGINAQLELVTPEGFCQYPDIAHHFCTDAVPLGCLVNGQFLNLHGTMGNHTDLTDIPDHQQSIAHHIPSDSSTLPKSRGMWWAMLCW